MAGTVVTPAGIVVADSGDRGLPNIVVAVVIAVVVGDAVGSCVCAVVAKIPADCKFGSILSLPSVAVVVVVVVVDRGVDREGIAACWLSTIGLSPDADGSIVVELAPVRTLLTSPLVVGEVAVVVAVGSVGVVAT